MLSPVFLTSIWMAFANTVGPSTSTPREKPRLCVLTDISNEPDDEQSLIRLLLYANEIDIECLIATTGIHLKQTIAPERIVRTVAAYGEVVGNLGAHAGGYPSAALLHSRIKSGNPGYGIKAVGPGLSSEGSKHLIHIVDSSDDRPVWVAAWGGANTLAQALFDVRRTRSRAAIDAFVAKIRVYAISDQDDAGPWLRKTFKNLYYVVSPSVVGGNHLEYYESAWSGISGDRFYKNGPGIDLDLCENPWLRANVAENHGPLGALYPRVEYIMEGDTPSFLNLIANGLGAERDPSFGGWGGRYVLRNTRGEDRPIYTHDRDTVTVGNNSYTSAQATIWRWRRAFQHDFAARMDWSVQPERARANHNPRPVVDGDASQTVVETRAFAGTPVTVSARGSTDPDGDELRYRWFIYPEAGTLSRDKAPSIVLRGAGSPEVSFDAPSVTAPGALHLILEVSDSGSPSLYAYRRVIVNVFP